jgi:hypothetical protein
VLSSAVTVLSLTLLTLLTLLTRRVLLSLEVPPSPSGRLSSATRTVEMWHHEELGQCAQYGHEGLVGRGSRPDGSDRWVLGSTVAM